MDEAAHESRQLFVQKIFGIQWFAVRWIGIYLKLRSRQRRRGEEEASQQQRKAHQSSKKTNAILEITSESESSLIFNRIHLL